jgi:hypothetical protein
MNRLPGCDKAHDGEAGVRAHGKSGAVWVGMLYMARLTTPDPNETDFLEYSGSRKLSHAKAL